MEAGISLLKDKTVQRTDVRRGCTDSGNEEEQIVDEEDGGILLV